MIDEAECICSVLLAIVLSHAIGAVECRLGRILRLHGDALARRRKFHARYPSRDRDARWCRTRACRCAFAAASQPVLLSLGLLIGGGITLYFAIVGRRAYAWLFTGLTFLMVLIEAWNMRASRSCALPRRACSKCRGRYHRLRHRQCDLDLDSAVARLNPDNNLRAKPVDQPTRQWHATVARHALVGGSAWR